MKYSVKAPAKVNIGLRVLPVREDGYHPLKTYFHLINLADDLEVEINSSEALSVSISGNESYLEEGKRDLMEKAAVVFSELSGLKFDISIKIDKHIPHQAGLGGGSSDAAAVLLCLNRHFSSPLDRESIQQAALSLGSDVPFFTSGYAAAYAEGRGEILTPVEPVSYPLAVVMKKGDMISTRDAFRVLDSEGERDQGIPSWPLELNKWRGAFVNDFLTLQNIVKEECYHMLSALSDYDSVSGSGSACFLVFKDEMKREDFSVILNQLETPYLIFFTEFCCKTLL